MASIDIRVDVSDDEGNIVSHRESTNDNELDHLALLEIHLPSVLRAVIDGNVMETLARCVMEAEMAWQDRDDVALAEGDFHRAAFAYLKAISNHRRQYIPESEA